jgi:hypothetical protein
MVQPQSFEEVDFLYKPATAETKEQWLSIQVYKEESPARAKEALLAKKKQIEALGKTPVNEISDLGDYAFSIHEDKKRFYFCRGTIWITAIGMGGPHLTKDVLKLYDSKIQQQTPGK